MVYPVRKYERYLPKFGVMNNAFNEEEIERIVFLEKILQFDVGAVGEKIIAKEVRNSNVSFLNVNENTEWLYAKIASLISKANYDLFMLDIEQIETLQYTIYHSSEEQHYDWHVDSHAMYDKFCRKISGTIVLSDPDSYEGGEFEIIVNGNPEKSEKLKPKVGEVVFFSSDMPHKVHPVTSGVRKSLVFWVLGQRES